ncbi:MAG: hypothetical protein WC314_17495 [Vulcanimicrobiota bacterium]
MNSRWNPNELYSLSRDKIYTVYSYVKGCLGREGIEVAIFSESPHHPFNYLIYVASRILGIEVVMFSQSIIPDRIAVTTGVAELPIYFEGRHRSMSPSETEAIRDKAPEISILVSEVRKRFSALETKPAYMVHHKRKQDATIAVEPRLRHLFRPRMYWRYLKEAWRRVRYRYLNDPRTILKREYDRLVSPTAEEPYVLVALHYQPERTTNPEGGIFEAQALLIRLLAATLPPSFQICVKEHPTQFNFCFPGHLSRSVELYKSLSLIPNLRFIDAEQPASRWAKNAEIIVTVNGTIGFEAAIIGKPVIAFGSPPYTGFPNVHIAKHHRELKELLAEILTEKRVSVETNDDEVFRYLAALHSVTFPGYINPSYIQYSKLSSDTVASSFVSGVKVALGLYSDPNNLEKVRRN